MMGAGMPIEVKQKHSPGLTTSFDPACNGQPMGWYIVVHGRLRL